MKKQLELKKLPKVTATIAFASLLSASIPLLAAPNNKLILNGKVASNQVKTVNGQAVISLSDLAKGMGMVVVKVPGGFEIKKPGGTYQVQDLSGNIGDVLFNGKWRFQVLSVQSPQSFAMRTDSQPYNNDSVFSYNQTTRILRPLAGYKLVVIQCRVTNGQKTKQTMWTSISDTKMRTALTDFSGGSQPPIAYDYEGGPNVTRPLLPGAVMTFPIIFAVRSETRLKDLVFTMKNNDTFEKGSDARVSLSTGLTR